MCPGSLRAEDAQRSVEAPSPGAGPRGVVAPPIIDALEPEGNHSDAGVLPSDDGRRLRRDRNRRAVLDALLDLCHEGNLRPSTAEVAARAGISPRSVFRYFDDADDLSRSAVARQQERAQHLFEIDAAPDDPVAVKIEALVDQRFGLFREVAEAATVTRLRAPFQPVLAEELARNRAMLRQQVEHLMGPQLSAMGQQTATTVLAATDVLSSFECLQLLLKDWHLPEERAKAVLHEALGRLVGLLPRPPGPQAPSVGGTDR